jgi:hypothetical protein
MSRTFAIVLALGTCPAAAFAQADAPRTPANPQEGTYRSRLLGIDYTLVPYNGHFGARLAALPAEGSPLRHVVQGNDQVVYLEPGDMITALDGRLIDEPKELEAHYSTTTIEFHNARSGRIESGTIQLPGGGQGGGAVSPESARVHALLIIDTDTKLNGLAADKDRMATLLQLVGDDRLDMVVFEGEQVTAENVIRQLRALGDASGDTLVVYYSGHGATDPARGHALTLSHGPALFRSQLRQEVARLKPRLGIILSDCCSNVVNLPVAPGAGAPDAAAAVRSLFLRTSGLVDINGSTYDRGAGVEESAWCLADGGFFTKAVFEAVAFTAFDELDRDHDGLLRWGECLPFIAARLKETYGTFRREVLAKADQQNPRTVASLRRQPNQTPQAFALDGGLNQTGFPGRRALGVNVTMVRLFDPGANANIIAARIESVNAGGPAARIGLEPGDIITHVGGAGFGSYDEFLQTIANAPDPCPVRLRNVRTGQFVIDRVTFGG